MADLELNPFQQQIPIAAPISSLQVTTNLDWLDVPELITGQNAFLPIEAKTDVAALKVFGTGASVGTPTMLSLTEAHIPTLSISKITGLQGAINALVKTLASAHASLTVNNNGVGDYTLTPNFGATSSTFAIGNDTRFPANVTGLRKSAGAGSTDTAAVAKTDYWNTDVFVASGASHAKGLVPDPGASAGATKYLNEDGTWKIPTGTGTVTSVALTLPSFLSVTGSPVTTSGTLAVSLANQSANTHLAGPTSGGAAAPTFRALHFNDVSGLTGTGATNIAIGNDTRFPASVNGLRKGAGAGSADTAALVNVDYWDSKVFGAKGVSHSIGLVPDPGTGSPPYTRYLREDSTWQAFIPDVGTITNTMLAIMSPKTVKANIALGSASPSDVSAKDARSSQLFNLESITTNGNSDYTILSTDRVVATSATITADRTWTLPLANTFNPGQTLRVVDAFGGLGGSFKISIARAGADVIQDSSQSFVLQEKYSSVTFVSNGVSKWYIVDRSPKAKVVFLTASTTYTTPTGVKSLYVEGVAGGGGGAGAQASASNSASGAGGAGGAHESVWIKAPTSSYSVTVGAGGSAGAGANGTGGTGGDTLFGSVLTAKGGQGGACTGAGTVAGNNGSGGQAISAGNVGDFLRMGSDGKHSYRLANNIGIAGAGGDSYWGGSKRGADTTGTGNAGMQYGGGGSGASSNDATAFAGGAGAQGAIKIVELY